MGIVARPRYKRTADVRLRVRLLEVCLVFGRLVLVLSGADLLRALVYLGD